MYRGRDVPLPAMSGQGSIFGVCRNQDLATEWDSRGEALHKWLE